MSLSVAALSAVLGGGGAGGELEGVHIPPGIILHQVPVSPSTLKQSGMVDFYYSGQIMHLTCKLEEDRKI